jgi:hypothetical protein
MSHFKLTSHRLDAELLHLLVLALLLWQQQGHCCDVSASRHCFHQPFLMLLTLCNSSDRGWHS